MGRGCITDKPSVGASHPRRMKKVMSAHRSGRSNSTASTEAAMFSAMFMHLFNHVHLTRFNIPSRIHWNFGAPVTATAVSANEQFFKTEQEKNLAYYTRYTSWIMHINEEYSNEEQSSKATFLIIMQRLELRQKFTSLTFWEPDVESIKNSNAYKEKSSYSQVAYIALVFLLDSLVLRTVRAQHAHVSVFLFRRKYLSVPLIQSFLQ